MSWDDDRLVAVRTVSVAKVAGCRQLRAWLPLMGYESVTSTYDIMILS